MARGCWIATCVLVGGLAASAWAEDAAPLAQVVKIVVGDATVVDANPTADARVIRAATHTVENAQAAMSLYEGDEVATGPNVSVELQFLLAAVEEDRTIVVGAGSQVQIVDPTSLFVRLGRILANVRGLFQTPTAEGLLKVRGTEYEVRVAADGATRLLVLEGAVDVEPLGSAGAADETPGSARGFRATVVSGDATALKRKLTLRNGCQMPHTYDFRAPVSLPWVSVLQERVEVAPGETRSVMLSFKLDARRVSPGTVSGDVAVACLDCEEESGCEQQVQSVPLRVDVIAAGAPDSASRPSAVSVGRLEEVTFRRNQQPPSPRRVDEPSVRDVIDWSSGPVLAGRPIYATDRVVPRFNDGSARGQAFRDARLRAAWNNDPSGHELLGRLYADWGEGAKAVESMHRAERVDPKLAKSPRFLTDLGKSYRAAGRLDEAEAPMKRALDLDPKWAPAHNALGNLYLDRARSAQDEQDAPAAKRYFNEADRAFRTFEEGASSPEDRAIALSNRGEVLVDAGESALAEGRHEEARRYFEKAAGTFRSAANALPRYAQATAGLGDAYRGLGRAAQARGDSGGARDAYRQAEAAYTQAQSIEPRLARASIGLGDVYRATGRSDQALARYRRAAALDPREPTARYALGSLSAQLGNQREATENMKTFLDLERPARKKGVRARDAEKVVGTGAVGPRVPRLVGMMEKAAVDALRAAGYAVGSVVRRPGPEPPGTVVDQQPAPQAPAPRGSSVDLTVAVPGAPTRIVKLPGVEGKKRADALEMLAKLGLRGEIVEEARCEDIGEVVRQSPRKGAELPVGSTVGLSVASAGPAAVTVPGLKGVPQERAEAVLSKLGLRTKIRQRETADAQPRTILDQRPQPGEPLAPGCTVELAVAAPIPLVTVPNLVGMSEAEALQRLPGGILGAFAPLRRGEIHGRGGGGRVLRQSPEAGTEVRKGTSVDLWIGTSDGVDGHSESYVQVPDLRGRTLKDAATLLGRLGLRYERTGRGDCVARHDPGGGARAPKGSSVTLVAGACTVIQ